jgi:pyruvate oxidase
VARSAAALLVEALESRGVPWIAGLPGDAVDPLLEPLRRASRIRFVQVRHEETAAFMASAYGKLTGRLAACCGTAGPGAIHLLNGLYDAKLDRAPVLALTGQVSVSHLGTAYFQEVDLVRLFSDVAVFNERVDRPDQMARLADLACHVAESGRGVAHLSLPFDALQEETAAPLVRYGPRMPDRPEHATVPTEEQLDRAAALLAAAERPVILAGRGAVGARSALLALAERLKAPVVYTLPGKAAAPDTHPLVMGGLGLLGAGPAHAAMEDADAVLLIGTQYPYGEFVPHDVPLIQIDWDATHIGRRMAVDLGLVGAVRPTVAALTDRLQPQPASPRLERLQSLRRKFLDEVGDAAAGQQVPINPEWVINRLSAAAAPDANVAVDVGNALVWMARGFMMREHGWLVSSWLGSMGFGLPAALAAKLADPRRQAIAVVGDGGFAMLMADFVTAVKYQLPVTVVVLNNHRLAMIKFEQEVAGYPEFGTRLTNPDFAAFAKAAGGDGMRVTEPDGVEEAIRAALKADVPVVVDVDCDPNHRPMPPRVTPGQAYGYATAWVKETLGL